MCVCTYWLCNHNIHIFILYNVSSFLSGYFFYLWAQLYNTWHIFFFCFRFWEAIRHSAESHQTDHQRQRRYCSVRKKNEWMHSQKSHAFAAVAVWWLQFSSGIFNSHYFLVCSGLSQEQERRQLSVCPYCNVWTFRSVCVWTPQMVFVIVWSSSSSSSYCDVSSAQVRETQALILAPTRELAGQIQKVLFP